MSRVYLLVTRDLMLASQVAASARPCGADIRQAEATDVDRQLADAAGVLWDLESGLPEPATVDRCRAEGREFIACGPHVRQALLEQAQQMGCQPVLPRGQFVRRLAELLT